MRAVIDAGGDAFNSSRKQANLLSPQTFFRTFFVYSGRNYVALGNVNDVNPLPKEGRGGIKLKNIVVGFRTKYQTAGIHRFEKRGEFPWRTIGSFPDSPVNTSPPCSCVNLLFERGNYIRM